jgi:hypothetical protein
MAGSTGPPATGGNRSGVGSMPVAKFFIDTTGYKHMSTVGTPGVSNIFTKL